MKILFVLIILEVCLSLRPEPSRAYKLRKNNAELRDGTPYVQQFTYVETVSKMFFPRFDLRVPGGVDQPFTISALNCSHEGNILNMEPCEDNDGTCYQLSDDDIPATVDGLEGQRIDCFLTTTLPSNAKGFPLIAFDLIDDDSWGSNVYASTWIRPGGGWVLLTKANFTNAATGDSDIRFRRELMDLSWPASPVNQFEVNAIIQTFEVYHFIEVPVPREDMFMNTPL